MLNKHIFCFSSTQKILHYTFYSELFEFTMKIDVIFYKKNLCLQILEKGQQRKVKKKKKRYTYYSQIYDKSDLEVLLRTTRVLRFN